MNHNNLEIERKFLVRDESYKAGATESHLIKQGYISKAPGRTVRVRVIDNKAYLTIKVRMADTCFTRHEWEWEIPVRDAEEMLAVCLPGLIEKRRWIIPVTGDQLVWEVDEFMGRLAGLTLAEIELESEEQQFDKPDFITEEVTGDPRYYNANM